MPQIEERPAQITPAEIEMILKMRIKVVYRETGETRYVSLDEAKSWDWKNQNIWRIVSGWQITSFNALLNMMHMKAQKGIDEVEILESPRSMLLAGG